MTTSCSVLFGNVPALYQEEEWGSGGIADRLVSTHIYIQYHAYMCSYNHEQYKPIYNDIHPHVLMNMDICGNCVVGV